MPWFFAKVQNCPIEGLGKCYTCYATDYADTFFSVPSVTKIKGKRVTGYFTFEGEDEIVFRLHTGGASRMSDNEFIVEVINHITGEVVGSDRGSLSYIARALIDILLTLEDNQGVIINTVKD